MITLFSVSCWFAECKSTETQSWPDLNGDGAIKCSFKGRAEPCSNITEWAEDGSIQSETHGGTTRAGDRFTKGSNYTEWGKSETGQQVRQTTII